MNNPPSSTRTWRFWLVLVASVLTVIVITAFTTALIMRPAKVPSKSSVTVDPSTFTTADLRGKLTGTFATPPGARLDLSFIFNYPLYELGPSTTTVCTGTWDIDDTHPLLTPGQRAQGWHMMLLTAPGDATKAPSRVRFTFDAEGQITAIEWASFLGIESAPDKHMFLYRKSLP
jgi:hypothetical protein